MFSRIPLEIRHDIYILLGFSHAHLQKSSRMVCISVCIEPNATSMNDLDGSERCRPGGNRRELTSTCARRLRSTWGPHWRCEEVSHEIDDDSQSHPWVSLAMSCKMMYMDVLSFMAENATFNVTDIDTLHMMLSALNTPMLPNICFTTAMLSGIKTINITLRCSVSFWNAIEGLVSTSGVVTRSTPAISEIEVTHSTLFADLWQAIARLEHLRTLRIWLDHDGPELWTVVNERAILSLIEAPLSGSHISVFIHLPFIHPKYEVPTRHFTPGSEASKLDIQRRLRQRWYYLTETSTKAKYILDFPILFPEFELMENMTIEEAAVLERKFWEDGIDCFQEIVMSNFGSYE